MLLLLILTVVLPIILAIVVIIGFIIMICCVVVPIILTVCLLPIIFGVLIVFMPFILCIFLPLAIISSITVHVNADNGSEYGTATDGDSRNSGSGDDFSLLSDVSWVSTELASESRDPSGWESELD